MVTHGENIRILARENPLVSMYEVVGDHRRTHDMKKQVLPMTPFGNVTLSARWATLKYLMLL